MNLNERLDGARDEYRAMRAVPSDAVSLKPSTCAEGVGRDHAMAVGRHRRRRSVAAVAIAGGIAIAATAGVAAISDPPNTGDEEKPPSAAVSSALALYLKDYNPAEVAHVREMQKHPGDDEASGDDRHIVSIMEFRYECRTLYNLLRSGNADSASLDAFMAAAGPRLQHRMTIGDQSLQFFQEKVNAAKQGDTVAVQKSLAANCPDAFAWRG